MQTQTGTNGVERGEQQVNPTWLTLEEGATRARVHTATLRRAIRAGQLRHARVSGRKCIRLRPEWIDGWLDATITPVGKP